VIDGWLVDDQDAPKKQRHTARRVWQRLVAEHGATASEVTVSRYVARRRVELGLAHREVSIPQTHVAGAEGEVDFAAVVRVLKGRDRTESERFTALRSHYGFDSFFCRPGIEGAHEKGGVEGEIDRFRRRHLVPVPNVTSLGALNELLAATDLVDDARVITGRPATIEAAFTAEAPHLMPLPGEPFDAARQLEARVDNRARVSVRQCFYSVPARYTGRRLPVRLAARTVQKIGVSESNRPLWTCGEVQS
jgi:hypothetical protein